MLDYWGKREKNDEEAFDLRRELIHTSANLMKLLHIDVSAPPHAPLSVFAKKATGLPVLMME